MMTEEHDPRIAFAELSDPGRDPSKQVNEDACRAATTPHGYLAVVCDGMGGHTSGQNASRTAVATIVEAVSSPRRGGAPEQVLKVAIEQAGRAVFALGASAAQELRPGSTCVALLITGRAAVLAHVGDSRAYLIRDRQIEQLTRDHSMVEEMVLARLITPEQAKDHPDANKITRALGILPEVDVDIGPKLELRPNDVLLLATDGLTDMLSDAELAHVVRENLPTGVPAACHALVARANERGGHDNITVQLIHVLEIPEHEPASKTMHDGPVVAGRALPHTLFDEPRQGTAARAELGAAAPTLLDEGPHGARTTEPGLARSGALPHFETSPPEPRSPPRKRSLWLLLAVGITGLLAAAIVLGWFRLQRSRQAAEEPPPLPPEPVGVAAPASAPELTLPSPEPIRADAAPSGIADAKAD